MAIIILLILRHQRNRRRYAAYLAWMRCEIDRHQYFAIIKQ